MLYFAYGSNLDEDQMHERCPGSAVVSAGRLNGHSLVFAGHSQLWDGAVATVVPSRGHVPGLLYRITRTDLSALDHYEGYPKTYTRAERDVTDGRARVVSAITYFLPEALLVQGEPSELYVDVLAEAYRKWGFDRRRLSRPRGQSPAARRRRD
jgi:gamma-glutamylcyclotransferase (GGCT)/AIG2-like uncharacterized protein YtfP